jgi:hypothetical protein
MDSVVVLDPTLRTRLEALARELGFNSIYEVVDFLINYYYNNRNNNICRRVSPWLVKWLREAVSKEWVVHALGQGLARDLARLGRLIEEECHRKRHHQEPLMH